MQTGQSCAIRDFGERMPLSVRERTLSPGWRRRRLWVSRWRRLTRWEYWPLWAIYPPVVAYVLWLGLRHRGFTLFTAVNPGMPAAGGVVGRSKIEILRGLAGAGDRVAAWAEVEPGPFPVRNARVRKFMAERGSGYPVVIKPDCGERGAGVVIARNAQDVETALRDRPGSLIVQSYVPGVEYGVFYIRRPDEERGHIFAVTDKRQVAVVGDGVRSLEELILFDERAVGMARYFLRQFAGRLAEIPPVGSTVVLGELGTHCRGALFLDGDDLVTREITEAIDEISRTYDGFHFGRYDVRARNEAVFRTGKFQVIELNGVTSEATNIYDPRHSVWHGWRILCRQWEIAFEIGAANRARGVRPLSLRALLNLVRHHHPV